MKLLLITAIQEFESEVKNILIKSGAKSFTYNSVKGFKNDSESNVVENWFASSYTETDSVLFTVFLSQENMTQTIKKIEEFNDLQKTFSKIHIGVVAIKKQF